MSDKQQRNPILSNLYREYLEHQDSAKFVDRVSHSYTAGTLERMSEHPHREIRRASVLALGMVGDYVSNHPMGRAMSDEDRTVRLIAQNGIRNIWNRAGDDRDQQALSAIIRLNAVQQYRKAITASDELIERSPWFAEAWHQRGSAQHQIKNYDEAISDCLQSLEINPYHFPAATCMGRAYMALNNGQAALECFRRALRVNPDLEGVRAQVIRLAKSLGE